MLSLIESLRRVFFKDRDYVSIDNVVFQCHYRFTSVGMFLFFFVVYCREYFGDPIQCFTGTKTDVSSEVLNAYCYVQSTYTLPGGKYNQNEAAPGIRPRQPDDLEIYHKYYQWMSLFLLLESVLFSVTHYVWKVTENYQLANLMTWLTRRKNGIENADQIIPSSFGFRDGYKWYAYTYFFCELVNFIHVLAQIYFINFFIGGHFLTYGLESFDFMQREQNDRHDRMIRIFPRLTKCRLDRYGPSGDFQNHDILCVLTTNVLNEKIFIILWLWLICLSIISGLCVLYRIPLFVKPFRRMIITRNLPPDDRNRNFELPEKFDLTLGCWMILKRLKDNMNASVFKDLLVEYSERPESKQPSFKPLLDSFKMRNSL